MGVGHDLGEQLRAWLEADAASLRQSRALTNRLIDALGANDSLKGPIRDLASQPLLLQALHSQGGSQRSAVASLSAQLSGTYAPAVLAELLDLIAAATGVDSVAPAEASEQPTPPAQPQQPQEPTPAPGRSAKALAQAFGPGAALAASGALVFAWCGAELDRALFEGWGWSGGVVLVLVLGLVQALAIGPCKQLRRIWSLSSDQSRHPREAWRWLSQAWVHGNGLEASLNLILLLILLGSSPLQLRDVILRYSLTGLACLLPAAVCASQWGVSRRWNGAAGAISALISLAAALSLLHWRPVTFNSAGLSIPAWVLLLVNGALQLGWQLPRQAEEESSQPLQRLLSSSWGWGLLLGLSWAVITRLQELL
jgi:hypothetical protein